MIKKILILSKNNYKLSKKYDHFNRVKHYLKLKYYQKFRKNYGKNR